jgi:hypothetical protein
MSLGGISARRPHHQVLADASVAVLVVGVTVAAKERCALESGAKEVPANSGLVQSGLGSRFIDVTLSEALKAVKSLVYVLYTKLFLFSIVVWVVFRAQDFQLVEDREDLGVADGALAADQLEQIVPAPVPSQRRRTSAEARTLDELADFLTFKAASNGSRLVNSK